MLRAADLGGGGMAGVSAGACRLCSRIHKNETTETLNKFRDLAGQLSHYPPMTYGFRDRN
jgi:hypothetical protein